MIINQAGVCQTCGDTGYKELLLCCIKCQISVEHRYCLAKIPKADDKEFTYTCAQCVKSYASQTSSNKYSVDALRLRPSHQKKHIRQRIDEPAALVHDLKKSLASHTSSVAEVESQVQTCDVLPSLQTSVTEPLLKDVLPQADRNRSRSLCRVDEPTALLQDLKKKLAGCSSSVAKVEEVQTRDVPPSLQTSVSNHSSAVAEVEAEVPTCDVLSSLQTSVSNHSSAVAEVEVEVPTCDVLPSLQTSVSEPFIKDVLPKVDLNENNKSPRRIDQPAALLQDLKKRQANSGSSVVQLEEIQTHDVPPSLQSSVSNSFVKDVLLEDDLKGNNRSPHCYDVSSDGDQEFKRKRRRVIQDDWNTSDEEVEGPESQVVVQVDPVATGVPLEIPSPYPFIDPNYVYAQPIIDPVWRGCFEIGGEKIGWLEAHLSNKACLQVVETAKLMSTLLCIKNMPRLDAWPKSFNVSAPSDESIALYFFPGSESVVKAFDNLTNHIIEYELALKVLFDNAELLIFSSNHLPRPYWRFNGRYYLWGVFRGRKHSSSPHSGDSHMTLNSSTGCSMSISTLEIIKKSGTAESLRRSPLSPLCMSGSYSSDSPRSPLPPANKTLSSK